MATFAFIHGGGDVGWYWHLVEKELRARGHGTVAPDLPCDDDSATLSDYADTVVRAIDGRRDVVVVAQSYGGFTAPLVADRLPIDALVLVAAMIPAPGEKPADWWIHTGHRAGVREQAERDGGVTGNDDPFVAFYHDVPRALAEEAMSKERGESEAAYKTPWPLEEWPAVPTRFVLCTQDRFFPEAFMHRVVAERLGVVPDEIEAGHCVALSRPRELADLLVGDSAFVGRAEAEAPATTRWPPVTPLPAATTLLSGVGASGLPCAMVRAAVLAAVGQPLQIRDDIEVENPRAGEVLLRVAASGVCHSDLSRRDGTMMTPVPIVLGHEGAGVVEAVGDGVTSVAPGDHVVVSWVPQCGACFFCRRGQSHLCERATTVLASGGQLDGTTRLTSQGAPLYQMAAAGTFSELTVISETAAVKIDDDLDLSRAALLGCAVLTGTGAAMRTAAIEEGDCVAVVGCGGVGLNVIQGARIRRAGRIIAVDTIPATLELATAFGATDGILVDPTGARSTSAVSAVMAMTCQRGADVVFEVIGLQATIDQTLAMTRRGGQAVLVGIPAMDAMVNLPAFFGLVLAGKTIHGCWYGSSNVRTDIPALIQLYREGRLLLDELVTRTITLDEVDGALDAMHGGSLARTVIVH